MDTTLQALYQSIKEKEWIEMHEKLKEVCKQIGVRRSARRSRNESKS